MSWFPLWLHPALSVAAWWFLIAFLPLGCPASFPKPQHLHPIALLHYSQDLRSSLPRPEYLCDFVPWPLADSQEWIEVEALQSEPHVPLSASLSRFKTIVHSLSAWRFFAPVLLQPACQSQGDFNTPHPILALVQPVCFLLPSSSIQLLSIVLRGSHFASWYSLTACVCSCLILGSPSWVPIDKNAAPA